MKRLLIAVAGAALASAALTACATSTPTAYQPRIAGAHVGGYSEQRLDVTHWQVRFSGNSLTSRETVECYMLFRAAELTLQHGGDWFDASNKDIERRMRFDAPSDPRDSTVFGRDYGWGWRPQWRYHSSPEGWRTWDSERDASFWSKESEVREVDRFIASLDIEVGKGPTPEGRKVYDARQVKAELGPEIVRPQP